ncbi:sensor histidine kinase [Dethiosulfatarculus sandiegensis]|uniref:histidine kinase n=1 Tax=Dethiosulfatarculus sandiegensis TaxID=1429043 RepID=A0A0D2GJD2_9BACT|nr:sensor histidine kinase [Dethiosulfatarculus sandiegensis]KIX14897.1 hypothetical protein X474_07045 [Dethiosulfatarculus sandiegensis]
MEKENINSLKNTNGNTRHNSIGGICHRVKNDFQTISNLLALAASEKVESSLLVRGMESRISALSTPYTLLADRGALPTVKGLVKEVVNRISWRSSKPLSLSLTALDLELSLRICSPLSLWLHEVISNCFIHAAHGSFEMHLAVMAQSSEENFVLRVQDNGPGLPKGLDPQNPVGLGMRIIKAISINDLRGRVEYESSAKGLSVILLVPREEFLSLNKEAWL